MKDISKYHSSCIRAQRLVSEYEGFVQMSRWMQVTCRILCIEFVAAMRYAVLVCGKLVNYAF